MTLRIASLAAAAIVAGAAPTLAADLPVNAPVMKAPAVAPVFNWTGFYAGLDAGYLWSKSRLSFPGGEESKPDADGFVGGGHLGYRHQFSSGVVLGIEGDLWAKTDDDDQAPYLSGGAPIGNFAILDPNWGGSIRGQLGYGNGPWLGYVTGGASYINYDGCTTSGGPCVDGTSVSDGRWGWTAGAGLAYAFAPNWSARLEYLYADYGEKTYATPGLIVETTTVDLRTHMIRAGASWKFNSH